jgi:hypothetical protein
VGKVVNQGVQWNKEPAAVAAVAAAGFLLFSEFLGPSESNQSVWYNML